MTEITVLGAGAFGTALAVILARRGRSVTLCVRRPEHCAELIRERCNESYLPGVELPPNLELTSDWPRAVATAQFIVMAVPSRFARAALTPLGSAIAADAIVISVTKGLEPDSQMTMSRMLATLGVGRDSLAVLSGPAFAAELARDKPAALVAAAATETVAVEVQRLFAAPRLRIYSSLDMVGVEMGGAVKNVIAVAAGIADGLELGSSARAGLITRGIAEMTRLAVASGGRADTIAGLAGLGDLVLTCTSDFSRNRRLGLMIARGERPPASAPGVPVAEGMTNSASIRMLAARRGVEMPIVDAVYRVLYEGLKPATMVEELLRRELKAEFGS
ncbi:MAG TPA: NAD(P)H-dependent glycerol-3-phosphate dehydrogenase [Candidatus Binataceae bacterium]|nr:NAD(P)H-dependent glycerol-3-phosphate dehydrogenase [Candidatus Binataceae bacterium]